MLWNAIFPLLLVLGRASGNCRTTFMVLSPSRQMTNSDDKLKGLIHEIQCYYKGGPCVQWLW